MIRLTAVLCILVLASCDPFGKAYRGWTTYNGTRAGMKYSSLDQVNESNVKDLQVVWTYHTGDADTAHHSQIQTNPIVVDGVLYGVSPQMKLFAIDAATGKEKWTFDPNSPPGFEENRSAFHIMINIRGVAWWSDGADDRRIYFTAGSFTYAIDATTGKPVPSFGKDGYIDLHEGLDRDVSDLFVVSTSPPMIYNDLLILGTRVDEAPPSAPGHIRAYDVRTGKRVWIFHTIPQPGEYGYETWEDPKAWIYTGGANAWSGFALDEERGILYVPTGSAAYDFYGGKRKGSNLFANCLLALDANTGERRWHFQFMHHDVWDKDLPTPPVLVTLKRNGKEVDAVAQTTKNGMVYVFDRATGEPLFDIEEVPVDTVSELSGEKLWPTQPVPLKPAPFVRQTLTAEDLNPYVSDSVKRLLQMQMSSYRYGNMFLPPGTVPSLVFPGYDGGGEWGGPAVDPETGILYVNANEMAWVMKMNPNPIEHATKETMLKAGQRLYKQHCQSCHGADRKGTGNNPTLLKADSLYDERTLTELLNGGRRMMPAFAHVPDEDKAAIATYVLGMEDRYQQPFESKHPWIDTVNHVPYKLEGYNKFITPDGYPAISPPWGTITAIDLNTGEHLWKKVLGEYESLKAKGVAPTGTENYGGPVVTAGGLVFIAATRDNMFRAFSKRTGELLWEYTLPASGFATPAVYEVNGRQYIVIACGGGKLGTKSGDAYVAFGLE